MGQEAEVKQMLINDSDIGVILPALDLYIEHLNQIADIAKQTAPAIRAAAAKAAALKEKLLMEDSYG